MVLAWGDCDFLLTPPQFLGGCDSLGFSILLFPSPPFSPSGRPGRASAGSGRPGGPPLSPGRADGALVVSSSFLSAFSVHR